MAKYAEKTTVSSEQSRTEIERTLKRYGATGFMYGWESSRAIIAFRAHNRMVRFELPMPDPDSPEFTHTPARRNRRSKDQQSIAYEQAVRQRWRALALAIKAKLEAVESGITDFESEFLAHIMLPDGSTVGTWARPQLEAAYERNQMPPMLPS
jgi:hypothetical protein